MWEILRRLIKGSFVYGLGSLSHRIIGFLLIPVYTRFLTTADYGIVAVAASVGSILQCILGMELRGAVVRHYYDYRDAPHEVREYVSTVFVFFLGVGLSIVVLLALFGRPLFDALFAEVPFHPYIRLTLWAALFTASGNIVLSLYRAREQAVRYVVLQGLKFLGSLGAIIFFVTVLQQGALGKIKGGFYAGLLFFVVFIGLTFREGTASFSVNKLKNALRFGLPLVPHALSAWVLAAADRFLLERLTSLSEVGLYNLGYQIGMMMSFIVTAVNFSWSPIFYDVASNRADAKALLSRMFTIYIVFVSTLAVGVILFSREVILILAAEPFHGAYIVVPAVAAGYLFQGLYFMSGMPIFYVKKTHVMPFLTGTAALLNIGLNIWWIPHYGMMGAAYATLVAFAFLAVSAHLVAQRFYRLRYAYGKIARVGLLVGGVYTANALLHFEGILVPIAVKLGILLAFLGSLLLLRVISRDEIRRLITLMRSRRSLGSDSEEHAA
jgi:O-antigen/teichoic acid export membrane protein